MSLDDAGRSGEKIGCDDSIVGVDVGIPPTTDPLRAAMKKLLSLHERTDPVTGLHNALADASLSVEEAVIRGEEAIVRLVGTLVSAGVCQDPRIVAQLERTAGQFPGVRIVSVFVNGCPIRELGREDDGTPHPACR